MMDPRTVAIPIAYTLLAALLCWHIISAKGGKWLKVIVFVVTLGFSFMIWRALSSYQGWPTAAETPEKALLIQAIVREPDEKAGDQGAIYLWLLPLSDEVNDIPSLLEYPGIRGEPRAYKMPYSREMHEGVNRAQGMMRAGKPVVMRRGGKPGRGSGQPGDGEPGEGDGDGDGQPGQGGPNGGRRGQGHGNGSGGYGDRRSEFQFYELPPAAPPLKNMQ